MKYRDKDHTAGARQKRLRDRRRAERNAVTERNEAVTSRIADADADADADARLNHSTVLPAHGGLVPVPTPQDPKEQGTTIEDSWIEEIREAWRAEVGHYPVITPKERAALEGMRESGDAMEKMAAFFASGGKKLKDFISGAQPRQFPKRGGKPGPYSHYGHNNAPEPRHPSRSLTAPPQAEQWNLAVPSLQWQVWDEQLANLLSRCLSDPEFVANWGRLLVKAEAIGQKSKSHPRGKYFCFTYCLTNWAKVLNNGCDWLLVEDKQPDSVAAGSHAATLANIEEVKRGILGGGE